MPPLPSSKIPGGEGHPASASQEAEEELPRRVSLSAKLRPSQCKARERPCVAIELGAKSAAWSSGAEGSLPAQSDPLAARAAATASFGEFCWQARWMGRSMRLEAVMLDACAASRAWVPSGPLEASPPTARSGGVGGNTSASVLPRRGGGRCPRPWTGIAVASGLWLSPVFRVAAVLCEGPRCGLAVNIALVYTLEMCCIHPLNA